MSGYALLICFYLLETLSSCNLQIKETFRMQTISILEFHFKFLNLQILKLDFIFINLLKNSRMHNNPRWTALHNEKFLTLLPRLL